MADIVVGKVVDSLLDVAIKEITYMFNCSENVEKLKYEVKMLTGMEGRIRQQIGQAESKGEVILKDVEEWREIASVAISKAREFTDKVDVAKKMCCTLPACAHPRYGKMAEKLTSFLRLHQERGKVFETCVSLPARTPEVRELYERKNLENIHTQMSALKNIILALKNDKIQIVGITGLGGVGKTTLAQETAIEMSNHFAYTKLVTVSQTGDTNMIRAELQVAATRIVNGEKVLIILDDVWKEFELHEVGIPCGTKNKKWKILLTSRNEKVCRAMRAKKIISVEPLKDKEAMTLLERVVGQAEWDNNLKQVALDIVKECGGLPLFVQDVGKNLGNKEFEKWMATLRRLQDPIGGDVAYREKGLRKLQLSYEYLEDDVAKKCFLLCSVFPEDEIIDLKRLTHYGLCLEIFNNTSIQYAKDKVEEAVEFLKSSFLLQPIGRRSEEEEEIFKMHDLVRDMALLTTSEGDHKFWVESGKGLGEWQPEEHFKSYKKISLIGNRISELPEHELLFPDLDTFLIQDNELSDVANEFFRGMEKLKVLDMSLNCISSLPHSLKQLKELRMLDLSRNPSLVEISILGDLSCLVILKLRGSGIKNIPEEIGLLTKLRLLDVYECKDLSFVALGVVSKLKRLEELYVELNKEGNCNFLEELSKLKRLTILHLEVPSLHHILEDFQFENLKEFKIYDESFGFRAYPYKRIVKISETNFPFTMAIMKLIHVSEMLELWGIKDVDNILPDFCQEGFNELNRYENVRSLVRTSDLDALQKLKLIKTEGKFFSQLKEIRLENLNRLGLLWDRPHQYMSFSNLMTIRITNCSSLLELFPVSVAQELVSVRYLTIDDCENLMVVISARDEQTRGTEFEETGGSKTELAKLDSDTKFLITHIHLGNLLKLESFYSGHSTINYPSLECLKLKHCANMKRWSCGDSHMPKLKLEFHGKPCNINDYAARHHVETMETCDYYSYCQFERPSYQYYNYYQQNEPATYPYYAINCQEEDPAGCVIS